MDFKNFCLRFLAVMCVVSFKAPLLTHSAPVENTLLLEPTEEFEAAIDQVLQRRERAAPNLAVSVQVNAHPESIELHPGQTVQVRCSAQADLTINDFLYVGFFRQFGEYTHMSLSSGDLGITVEPTVSIAEDFEDFEESDNESRIRTVKVLTIGPEAYDTLDNGQNLFYCKGHTKSGIRKTSYFFVKRIPARNGMRPHRHPRFRRYTPPPRV